MDEACRGCPLEAETGPVLSQSCQAAPCPGVPAREGEQGPAASSPQGCVPPPAVPRAWMLMYLVPMETPVAALSPPCQSCVPVLRVLCQEAHVPQGLSQPAQQPPARPWLPAHMCCPWAWLGTAAAGGSWAVMDVPFCLGLVLGPEHLSQRCWADFFCAHFPLGEGNGEWEMFCCANARQWGAAGGGC